jgi:cytochrome c oxidase subunit 2
LWKRTTDHGIFIGCPPRLHIAGSVDAVFWGITLVCIFFAVLVAGWSSPFLCAIARETGLIAPCRDTEGIALELTWTLIPLAHRHGAVPVVGQRVLPDHHVPKGAMEVYVVGKQWMWKLQHPSGRWEMNELHVPVGRPVKLTDDLEDVIHSFGIPAFALSRTCFRSAIRSCGSRQPRPGRFHLFCSEFCGTNHAIMGGYVTVMEPGEIRQVDANRQHADDSGDSRRTPLP